MKLLLIAMTLTISSLASAKTVTFTTCSGGTKGVMVLDLAANTISIPASGGTYVQKSIAPITAITSDDISFLSSQGVISAENIQSGYKATMVNPEGGSITPLYYVNLKNGGQATTFGAVLLSGPCAK